jgi:hypothetical protein
MSVWKNISEPYMLPGLFQYRVIVAMTGTGCSRNRVNSLHAEVVTHKFGPTEEPFCNDPQNVVSHVGDRLDMKDIQRKGIP